MELLLMVIAGAFAADCPDPAAAIDNAEKLVLFADVEGARVALALSEAALACSPPVEPGLLAQMWLVEGAFLLDGGNARAAAVSFEAARRVDSTVWIDGFGTKRREAYDAAVARTGTGQIAIDLPAGVLGIAWIDGTEQTAPVAVAPGEHLVQYGADGRAWFAKIALVSENQVLHVQVPAPPASLVVVTPSVLVAQVDVLAAPIPAQPAEPEPVLPPVLEPTPAHARAYAHLALGANISFPTLSDASHFRLTERGAVILMPLELGGGVSGRLWARAAFSMAPLLYGQLPYVTASGDARTSGFAVGGHAAAGVSAGPMDLGLLGGGLWPSRFATALLVGFAIPGAPMEIELRPGVNVRAGTPEPAASLVLVFPGPPAGGRRR